MPTGGEASYVVGDSSKALSLPDDDVAILRHRSGMGSGVR